MPHLGGKRKKLSSALGTVHRQLKSGQTRGQNPRDLDPEQIAASEKKRDALEAEMKQKARERMLSRINGHTAAQAARIIEAVNEASQPARYYFHAIGGAGSSTDVRLQGKALIEQAKEIDRQKKRQNT